MSIDILAENIYPKSLQLSKLDKQLIKFGF